MAAMRALVFALTLLATSGAAAQAAPTSYEARVRQATEQIAHGDRATATTTLQAAIAEAPSRPAAYCTLGEAQRVASDFQGSLASFQSCLRFARDEDDVLQIARAMHGVATAHERLGQMAEARAAWLEFQRVAEGATRVASATQARERVSAIDVQGEQERVYVDVRGRIAERERIAREAAAAPPPPPPTSTSRGRTHR